MGQMGSDLLKPRNAEEVAGSLGVDPEALMEEDEGPFGSAPLASTTLVRWAVRAKGRPGSKTGTTDAAPAEPARCPSGAVGDTVSVDGGGQVIYTGLEGLEGLEELEELDSIELVLDDEAAAWTDVVEGAAAASEEEMHEEDSRSAPLAGPPPVDDVIVGLATPARSARGPVPPPPRASATPPPTPRPRVVEDEVEEDPTGRHGAVGPGAATLALAEASPQTFPPGHEAGVPATLALAPSAPVAPWAASPTPTPIVQRGAEAAARRAAAAARATPAPRREKGGRGLLVTALVLLGLVVVLAVGAAVLAPRWLPGARDFAAGLTHLATGELLASTGLSGLSFAPEPAAPWPSAAMPAPAPVPSPVYPTGAWQPAEGAPMPPPLPSVPEVSPAPAVIPAPAGGLAPASPAGERRTEDRSEPRSRREERSRERNGVEPPAVAPVAPTRAEAPGFLTVLTRPYSEVFVDGQPLGRTPVLRRQVPAGRHTVRLVTETGASRTINVTVRGGEVTQVNQTF